MEFRALSVIGITYCVPLLDKGFPQNPPLLIKLIKIVPPTSRSCLLSPFILGQGVMTFAHLLGCIRLTWSTQSHCATYEHSISWFYFSERGMYTTSRFIAFVYNNFKCTWRHGEYRNGHTITIQCIILLSRQCVASSIFVKPWLGERNCL